MFHSINVTPAIDKLYVVNLPVLWLSAIPTILYCSIVLICDISWKQSVNYLHYFCIMQAYQRVNFKHVLFKDVAFAHDFSWCNSAEVCFSSNEVKVLFF